MSIILVVCFGGEREMSRGSNPLPWSFDGGWWGEERERETWLSWEVNTIEALIHWTREYPP